MRIKVELEREGDGRWIADVVDLPGVLVHGPTWEAALSAAQALALRVLADRLAETRQGASSRGLTMSDLAAYARKRAQTDPEFAEGLETGYAEFKIGVLLRESREQTGLTQTLL